MKKIISFLIAVSTFTFAYAQNPKKHSNNNPPVDTFSRSLLWRISGNGLQKASWLFGTIHMICPRDYFWTISMQLSLDSSQVVCFEMNLDDPSIMVEAASSMIDTSGKTLKDYFTDEQYKKLEKYVNDSLGMPISTFQSMKPIALDMLMTSKNMSCSNPVSYEENILEDAKKSNKTITGLEEAKEQIAILESIPVDSIIKDMMENIKGDTSYNNNNYDDLVAAYKKQDLGSLYTLLQQSNDIGTDMGVFLDDRNKKWIGRIEAKMKTKPVFFAVGAGHLWGPNGVIALLRKKGYTVEAVR